MAQRQVIWSKTADKQLSAVLEYWVNRNKSNVFAKRLLELVAQKTALIAEKPLLFKLTAFSDMRMAALGHFSIYYLVAEEGIIVTAFWDNRQDPKRLLELLRFVE